MFEECGFGFLHITIYIIRILSTYNSSKLSAQTWLEAAF